MFSIKQLKSEIKELQEAYCELEAKYNELKETISSQEWLDIWHQHLANKESSEKQGHFFLNSKTDVNLLEQVISEINKNEDLCALFTTSDGATLSLRVHKQPKNNNTSFMSLIGKYEEE